jgi:hypothetical protein
MARGILPKVSSGLATPDPSAPCGRATPETALPHAVRAWKYDHVLFPPPRPQQAQPKVEKDWDVASVNSSGYGTDRENGASRKRGYEDDRGGSASQPTKFRRDDYGYQGSTSNLSRSENEGKAQKGTSPFGHRSRSLISSSMDVHSFCLYICPPAPPPLPSLPGGRNECLYVMLRGLLAPSYQPFY